MLRKPIEYLDFDDNLVNEDFYFNLTMAEIAEMELTYENGLTHHLKRIVATKDGAAIVKTFKDILAKSYGVKSEDGKRFVKTPELWEAFSQTNAYSVLFIELVTDAKKSAEFVVGIVPKDVAKKIVDEQEKDPIIAAIDKAESDATPMAVEKTATDYTPAELLKMPQEQFDALVGTDPRKMHRAMLEIAMQRKLS